MTETFPQARTMASFPPAVHDLLQIDALLSPEERATRYAVRAFMVRLPTLSERTSISKTLGGLRGRAKI